MSETKVTNYSRSTQFIAWYLFYKCNYPLIIMCNHATADAMLCIYNPAYPQADQSQTLHHEDYHSYTAGYGCSCYDA